MTDTASGSPAKTLAWYQGVPRYAWLVLFIAAPPLVRTIFFLPKTDAEKAAKVRAKAAKKAVAA